MAEMEEWIIMNFYAFMKLLSSWCINFSPILKNKQNRRTFSLKLRSWINFGFTFSMFQHYSCDEDWKYIYSSTSGFEWWNINHQYNKAITIKFLFFMTWNLVEKHNWFLRQFVTPIDLLWNTSEEFFISTIFNRCY